MPIDKPKAGETQDEYLSYCIPEEIKAGKEQDVAAAICISTYQKETMSKPTEQRIADKLSGIHLMAGLEDACWEGYEAIGTKILNDREVPNCVPIKD